MLNFFSDHWFVLRRSCAHARHLLKHIRQVRARYADSPRSEIQYNAYIACTLCDARVVKDILDERQAKVATGLV